MVCGMDKKHGKKLIAPCIIVALIVLYYVMIAIIFLAVPEIPIVVKLLMIIIPLALAGVAIAMLIERIKEIRSGEEDDLSQY